MHRLRSAALIAVGIVVGLGVGWVTLGGSASQSEAAPELQDVPGMDFIARQGVLLLHRFRDEANETTCWIANRSSGDSVATSCLRDEPPPPPDPVDPQSVLDGRVWVYVGSAPQPVE